MIPFGPWRPDLYGLNLPYVDEARGVLPGANSYHPWPTLAAISAALADTCRGAYAARLLDGSFVVYAGTATKLYKYATASTWTDVTRVAGGDYAVPADEYWSFTQHGVNLIACNSIDDVQTISVEAGSNFAALGGSPPKARYAKTVGDQVFLLGLAANPRRVQWSGRNNSAFWTAGSRDSDFQDFPDGGWTTGITSIEVGLLFQEGIVRRFVPTSDRAIYRFSRIEEARGLLAPRSLVTFGRVAYYLSEEGFYAQAGSGQSEPIGLDQVNDWFSSIVNTSRYNTVISAADPTRPRLYWLFPSDGNTGYVHDNLLCYDVALKQWSHADVSATYILPGAVAGATLEDLDAVATLDALTFSLDSRHLVGGSAYMGGFDSAFKLGSFTGDYMQAVIETADFQPFPNKRSFVRGIDPITDADNVTVKAGKKERLADDIVFGASSTMNTEGRCPVRSSGRVHRVQLTIESGESWTHVRGVEPDVVREGAN